MWDDVKGEKTAWDTIVWFSALVMMASYLNQMELTTWFVGQIQSAVASWGISTVLGTAFLVVVYLAMSVVNSVVWLVVGLIWWQLIGLT